MNLRTRLVFLSLILSLGLFAQKTQKLSQIHITQPVNITEPILVDSSTLKGEKYDEKYLLKTELTIPAQSAFTWTLKADTAGFFFPEKAIKGKTTLQLISFYVSTDRYGKGTLKVTSPNMLEILVDGKSVKSKTTKESNVGSAKDISADLNPYPLNSRVVIKLLSSADDKASSALKIEIENEKNDSLTVFSVSNTNKRNVNFTDMMLGDRVSGVNISPNGGYILISYRNTLGENSVSSTELYDIKSEKRVLIDANGSKRQLSWMPKSEKLFYISRIGEESNIITIDPATLQESTLAKNVPNEYFRFSPDEQSLFYNKQEKGDENKGDLKLLKSPEDRQDGYTNRSFIYQYDLGTGLSQQLTYGSHSTWISDISPDSKQMLFSISDEIVTERPFRKNMMFLLDLPSMKVDTLWKDEGFAHSASFSPDGKKILISGSGEAFNGISLNIDERQIANSYNSLAFIMDLKTKEIDPITKNFDPSIDSHYWSEKDNHIYFRTTDMDYVNVYRYDTGKKTFTKLSLEEDVVRNFSIGKRSDIAVYFGVSQSNSTRAYIYDMKNQKSKMIADPYNDRLSQMTLGEVKDWNFTNSDGIEIKGSYYLPPNFDPNKKYPMIVYYYGGTSPTSRGFEGPYPAHVFASQGYVAYIIQPSGATGFGQKFAAMHVNAWGKRTAEDIIEGVQKFLTEHSFVDEKKLGCIGASYGGFMTMYLQTRTDIFAAAVSHAGISSISSYWGEGYWGYTYSSGASAHSYPWNNHDLYVNQSPLFNADKVKTPILFTHGMVDTNVPIGESIQMYTALKILGVPTEFIQVKDENHGIMNYKRRVEWNNSIMAWFAKWLKDDNGWWKALYPDSK
ncbi:MAG: prolyl oligopeptidase family serine peptidase [Prevotella sp.]|jgi:dipeptidyl aminopeptidase/acylaminoacyl peptidase|nr:prolyl oligopeptidase family serine peptidase [Prevotella sp.]